MNTLSLRPNRRDLTAVLLFLLALAPRLPGLSRFLTSDEPDSVRMAGANVITAFLQGNWRGTYWHFYPGVTMSWLDALGLGSQYLWQKLTGQPVPPFADYLYGDILSLITAARLPYALLTAASIPAIYWLASRLLPRRVALIAALLLAVEPFFLAHSRVVHGDAPVTVFMAVSTLAFFVAGQRTVPASIRTPGDFFRQPGFRYLLLSAVAGGLAALTKAPGQFMALFVIGMSLVYAAVGLRRTPADRSAVLRCWAAVIAGWGVVSLAVFVLLWPSMWADPVGTIRQMLEETFGKVNAGHLVYFMGHPTLNPGPWFYPVVITLRTSPVTLVGVGLSLLWLWPRLGRRLSPPESRLNPVVLLWLFVISLLLFGDLSPKKQDRYLLPLFPFLDLLAAAGWGAVFGFRFSFFKSRRAAGLLTAGLLAVHALPVFTYYPYYLTYFNPLLGGPTRAAEITLIGWGEGMEQAAAYLNTKPNADRLYVASTPSQTLLPYFRGRGENFYTNDIAFRADYVVLYIAQVQRLAPSPEIVRYYLAQEPETVITIHGLPYARIYRSQKRILPDIPASAVPVNIGLEDKMRLAGYRFDPASGENPLRFTLYWHALAPIEANYAVSVRARAANGDLLAQRDSWPVDGLLPTSQWRQGDYVADPRTLDLPPEARARLHHLEIVVYNAVTGDPLGPPVTIDTAGAFR
ncbi:MAG: phospholipid carrier-dependent glycosyltransferase [Chloroflexi bacterium]|nr:MAG: phospholipid carrier-dependent glycosyltransferase [Chloroflexota bacterium]